MKETLTALLGLQLIDNQMQELEALKGDLPQKVNKLKKKLEQYKIQCENIVASLDEIKKRKVVLDVEIQDQQVKLEKYKEQLYAVTSNREYDAISVEIDSTSAKISETEDTILELLEEEETHGNTIAELEPEIAKLQKNLKQTEQELNIKVLATDEKYKECVKKRNELASSILQSALYQYERLRKGLGNTVIVDVNSGWCHGCHSAIPPQKLVEIRMMNKMLDCEHCGRILVFSETNGSAVN